MIHPKGTDGVAQSFFRSLQHIGDALSPARWGEALPGTIMVLALLPSAASSAPSARSDSAAAHVDDLTTTATSESPLPPRALLRIGTDHLRLRHDISAVAFSPDGRRIAAADANGGDGGVTIFNVASGGLVKDLAAPSDDAGGVVSVAFSPDGTKLLWGESKGEVALWDFARGKLLFRRNIHQEEVRDVAFSPDGSLIASAGGHLIQVRRTTDPEAVVRELRAQPADAPAQVEPAQAARGPLRFGCLAFTPDGTKLVGGRPVDATIFVWQVADGRLLLKIDGAHNKPGYGTHYPPLNVIAVTPDGRRIVSIGQTTKQNAQTTKNFGGGYWTMREVRIWNIETGERVADYHSDEHAGLGYGALARDGRLVAVADFNSVRILDAATGKPERSIALRGWSDRRPVFSPDGTRIAMPTHNAIKLFEVAPPRPLDPEEASPSGSWTCAAWSPAGDRIVTGQSDGLVRVCNAATGELIWHKLLAAVANRRGSNAGVSYVTYSRDGKLVIAAGRRDDPVNHQLGTVVFYDAQSGQSLRELHMGDVRSGALAGDNRMLVVAADLRSGGLHFLGIEVATGRTRWVNPPMYSTPAFESPAALQFEAKSPWFQAALTSGHVVRFNSLTGREQRRFPATWNGNKLDIRQAAFSTDGRTLVSSAHQMLYVWDVESGSTHRVIEYPQEYGCNLALAPDGHTLAVQDLRNRARAENYSISVFDINTNKKILTLMPPGDHAVLLTFSPDGTKLFSGLARGSGIVWDVRPGPEASGAHR